MLTFLSEEIKNVNFQYLLIKSNYNVLNFLNYNSLDNNLNAIYNCPLAAQGDTDPFGAVLAQYTSVTMGIHFYPCV